MPNTDDTEPTWGEVIAAWDPAIDGQGNAGLAAAADRLAAEAEMRANIAALDDDDLAREIAFADGFGPEADDNAPTWISLLHAEHARRSEADTPV